MLSLSIVVYSIQLADRECACVGKVAIRYVYMCLIYTYIAIIRLPNSACHNWECNRVDEVACSIYICSCTCCLQVHLSTHPLTDRECACVAKVAVWYVYMCLLYIYVVTLLLPNSACQNWECNCVDEVACSTYIYFCICCLEVHLSTQLHLPTGSVLAWAKSLFDTYICV